MHLVFPYVGTKTRIKKLPSGPLVFMLCTLDTWILGHDGDDRLVHLAVVVLGEALVRADVGGAEAVDLQLDDAIARVGARVLLAELDLLALVFERDLRTVSLHQDCCETAGFI
jgi:hypothetical protein